MLCFQIAIGVGIVIATIVGAPESMPWRWSIGAAAVPAAIMFGLLLRLPEKARGGWSGTTTGAALAKPWTGCAPHSFSVATSPFSRNSAISR